MFYRSASADLICKGPFGNPPNTRIFSHKDQASKVSSELLHLIIHFSYLPLEHCDTSDRLSCLTMDGSTPTSASPDVHTYHCLCTNLIFAATHATSTLSRRAAGQDKAYILPLPKLPSTAEADSGGNVDNSLASKPEPFNDFATMLSTTSDQTPTIVRREDGFDKRYIQRCARCNVPVGYHLDWSQFPSPSPPGETRPAGANTSVIYILPGGFLSTDEMAAGKDMHNSIGLTAS